MVRVVRVRGLLRRLALLPARCPMDMRRILRGVRGRADIEHVMIPRVEAGVPGRRAGQEQEYRHEQRDQAACRAAEELAYGGACLQTAKKFPDHTRIASLESPPRNRCASQGCS